jgi:hypothetical protein
MCNLQLLFVLSLVAAPRCFLMVIGGLILAGGWIGDGFADA